MNERDDETDKATLKAEREQVGSTYRGDWYRDQGIVPSVIVMWYTMPFRPSASMGAAELRRKALATHATHKDAAAYARVRSPDGGWVGAPGKGWTFIDRERSPLDLVIANEERRYAEERRLYRPANERAPRG